jgi:hypothetical protein
VTFVLPGKTGFNLDVSATEQDGTVGKARSIRRVADRGWRLLRTRRKHEHKAERESSQSTAHDTRARVDHHTRFITHNVKEFGRVPGLRVEDWA